MMNIEKERERFEKYIHDEIKKLEGENPLHYLSRAGIGYSIPSTNIEWNAWQAAKQDGITEEKARDILDPLPKSTMDGAIKFKKEGCYINNHGNFQPVLTLDSGEIDIPLEKMKAIVWWMENKA